MKKFNTTLGELYNIRKSIFNNDIVNMEFSRKGSLSVARNLKKIDEELTEYSKERDELIRKYSEDGTTMDKSNPKWDEFVEEFNSISSVETSIDINTIVENDLPENCSPASCLVLEFMIENDITVEE